MKIITLERQTSTADSTIGELDVFGSKVYTLEDPKQDHKVWGETRIPEGSYELNLRTEGGMHARYKLRYPYMHEGMLWLRKVPLFEWVYIHVGNAPKDTNGCILVGMERSSDYILRSREAYELIYPEIASAILDEGCAIVIS